MQLLRAPSLLPLPCWLQGSAAALPARGQIREKEEGCLAGRDRVVPPLQAWCLPLRAYSHPAPLRVSWGIPVTVLNRMRTPEGMVGKHWDLYDFSYLSLNLKEWPLLNLMSLSNSSPNKDITRKGAGEVVKWREKKVTKVHWILNSLDFARLAIWRNGK